MLVWRFVVQLIFWAQLFVGAIIKDLSYDPIEISKFKMAAAAILEQLNSGLNYVSACPMLVFILENILSSWL